MITSAARCLGPVFLLFHLYGPFASWGEIAVGERRMSWNRPSKSAVLGLIAAAIGIDRADDAAHIHLAEGYGFAVRVDRTGDPLRDYHTTQAPGGKGDWSTRREELADRSKLHTILSDRHYYTDAEYTVALWSSDAVPHTLKELRDALLSPIFALYLGRRACPPALPLAPEVVEANGLVEALGSYVPRFDLMEYRPNWNRNEEALLYWEPDPEPPGTAPGRQRTVTRRDTVTSRARRQFRDRVEYLTRLGTAEG